jgi:DNA replication and repair protein RecF
VADVRCWTRAALDLPEGLVVLTGPNGAGKTSLIEAVTLGCLGVSPRTSREAEVVRRGAEALRVAVALRGPEGTRLREIGYAPRLGRRLALDGVPIRSLAAWRARGAVLIFLPEELRAVKGPPAARRRVVDRLVEAADPAGAEALGGYGEALAQRNALLRRVRAGLTGPEGLAPWEARMAALGARAVRARRTVAAALGAPFARWLEALGGGPGGELALVPSPAELGGVADDDLEPALLQALGARREVETRAGQTLAGPHRDDLWIGTGDRDLRRLGSQGEQRTAVLALLLAGREHLAARATRPVLLLDDVLSELDPDRRRLLLAAVAGPGQAIVTSADPRSAEAADAAAVVRIEGGRLAA